MANKYTNLKVTATLTGVDNLDQGRSFVVNWDGDYNAASQGKSKTLGSVASIAEIRCGAGSGTAPVNGLCPPGSNLRFVPIKSTDSDYQSITSSTQFKTENQKVLARLKEGKIPGVPAISDEDWDQYRGTGVASAKEIKEQEEITPTVTVPTGDTLFDQPATSPNGESTETADTLVDLISQITNAGALSANSQKLQIFARTQDTYLQYPKDANYRQAGTNRSSIFQDSMRFTQFTYRPSQENLFRKDANNIALLASEGLKRNSNIKETIGTVRLPIPNNLQDKKDVGFDGASADTLSLGLFQAALADVAGSSGVVDLFGKAAQGAGDILNQLGDLPAPLKLQLSAVVAKMLLSKVNVNVDPTQAIARATGAIPNPNLELLFSGPSLRAFQFSFNLAPQGFDEAEDVRKIMRFFKQGMSPRKLSGKSKGFMIGTPNVFRVEYLNNDRRIKSLNAFKLCALTAANFDYAPTNQYAVYEDANAISQPVSTIMTLTFQELTPIFDTGSKMVLVLIPSKMEET
jgi:hypothetical protein